MGSQVEYPCAQGVFSIRSTLGALPARRSERLVGFERGPQGLHACAQGCGALSTEAFCLEGDLHSLVRKAPDKTRKAIWLGAQGSGTPHARLFLRDAALFVRRAKDLSEVREALMLARKALEAGAQAF